MEAPPVNRIEVRVKCCRQHLRPRLTHDARGEALCCMLKGTRRNLQEVAETSEDGLESQGWSSNIRDDIIKVVKDQVEIARWIWFQNWNDALPNSWH